MLKSLIEWFDEQLDECGPAAVFRGALAIIGIAVALAAVPGIPMVKIGVLLFAVLTLVFAGLLLLRDRRRLRDESMRHQVLLHFQLDAAAALSEEGEVRCPPAR